MICAKHNWWNVTEPCPQCAPPASLEAKTVTATETPPAPQTDLVLPEEVGEVPSTFDEIFGDTVLDIPAFLQRNKDGSFKWPSQKPSQSPAPDADAASTGSEAAPDVSTKTAITVLDPLSSSEISKLSETELLALVNSTSYTLVQRQPLYRELRDREDRKKSLARIAEMKAKKQKKDSAS